MRKLSPALRFRPIHLFLLFCFLFSFWLMFHTFSYDGNKHEMRIAFKLWSDFGAHIPLIRSFSLGGNWIALATGAPIEYPVFPGEPIRYHFFFDMGVGLLERVGVPIDWALNVPSALGFFALLLSIYVLASSLFSSPWVGVLAVVFFLLNGSLGFLRFFAQSPFSWHTAWDITHAKEFPAFAPWGPGDVTAFWNLNIYTNQRHLSIAFALVVGFILHLLKLQNHTFKKQLPWAFVWAAIIGLLPYTHQPTLLILGIYMACYSIFFPSTRLFLLTTGILSSLLVLPQLFQMPHGSSGVQWYPGYTIHGIIQSLSFPENILRLTTYWWNNIGAHLFLIPIGFLLAPKRAKLILLPMALLFIIGNMFKFSVEISANHKFFNFCMIMGNMLSAYTLVHFLSLPLASFKRTSQQILTILRIAIVTFLLGCLTLSGIIDFFVILNDTKGVLTDIPKNPVATWIAHNTPPTAVFLNSSLLYHPANIAGRATFMGWPYFSWSAGYDTDGRKEEMRRMFESDDYQEVCHLLRAHHIDYITYETKEQFSEIAFHEDLFISHFSQIYKNETAGVTIYQTPPSCP